MTRDSDPEVRSEGRLKSDTAHRAEIVPLHFVYIVRCADGTLYTGYARDPEARTAATQSGARRAIHGRAWARDARLHRAVPHAGTALSREHQIKLLTRRAKNLLVGRVAVPDGCWVLVGRASQTPAPQSGAARGVGVGPHAIK